MYKAKNGFILRDPTTPAGWEIKTAPDIITGLLQFPAFQTVADGFIWDALTQAIKERSDYKNIEDLAQFLAENYI